MVTATHWPSDFGLRDLGLPDNLVKGCTAVSGVFDLEPICFTYVNDPLHLDAESARRNSPLFLRPLFPTPLVVCWGDNETSEFKRQSRQFAEAWEKAGNPCEVFELAGFNHFDVIFALGDTTTRLGQAVMRQIGVSNHRF
jgi:arylformamidase